MADKKGIWQKYKVNGDKLEKARKDCPKCGQGYALAQHKNRNTCGSCGYSEYKKTEK